MFSRDRLDQLVQQDPTDPLDCVDLAPRLEYLAQRDRRDIRDLLAQSDKHSPYLEPQEIPDQKVQLETRAMLEAPELLDQRVTLGQPDQRVRLETRAITLFSRDLPDPLVLLG